MLFSLFAAASLALPPESTISMSSVKNRLFVLGLATFVGLNLLSNQLGAQTPAVTQAPVTTGAAVAAPQQGGELERITVTGYLIPRIGEGPQPVLTLDRDFMQKQGTQQVADVIQRLPGTPLTFNQGFATRPVHFFCV